MCFEELLVNRSDEEIEVDILAELVESECKDKDWFILEFSAFSSINGYLQFIFATPDGAVNSIALAIIHNYLLKNNYLSKLLLKRKQLIYFDYYGDLIELEWDKELKKFISHRYGDIFNELKNNIPTAIEEKINEEYNFYSYFNEESLFFFLKTKVSALAEQENNAEEELVVKEDSIETGYDYEIFVKNIFDALEWKTFLTSKSGDQGADIIIEKHDLRFVIQCKFYSSAVGNKAVQEVIAAKGFYEAFGAIVITNADYTKSARQLAESQSIALLHDSQIVSWSNGLDEVISQT